MTFKSEDEFENALIKILIQKGWEDTVINRPDRAGFNRQLGQYFISEQSQSGPT